MSTSLANVFGKRAVDPPTFSRNLKKKKKNLICVPNSKTYFFTSSNTNSPLLSSCHKKVKCKAISISFSINTIQYNEAVNSTSSKNSLSDTSKFQSFLKYLYNVDNESKSLTECLFLHRWFKLFLSLCSSLDKDGAYCLLCPLFAGKKNTAAKSFIFKRFKH